MHALVIDDSRAMRKVLSKILGDLGFSVVEAGNGQEALERMQSEAVDLALIDWNMPVMNGYEFLQAVRAQPSWADVRLMMVTTETGIEEMTKALAAGADEYVMKPFTKSDLVSKLGLMGFRREATP
ncbi:MAG: response regulator [Deltaproteobacteria bacterium]|jgi:two-component system chemotaxis response regulator CheY|nr:response regulator [Deltaproteobacteria bacterium]